MEKTMQSEVARLREQIRLEYEAAVGGLRGISEGAARHAFISAKYDQMGVLHGELEGLVGEREALEIAVEMTIGGGNDVNQTKQATP
jgi:hypothetical protein